jgi:DNA-nicking Smr family endonuclease
MARDRDGLTPHERALWRRVAASVRPLPGRALPHEPASPPAVAAPEPRPMPVPPPMPVPRRLAEPPRFQPPPPPEQATLDGQWDRRMRMGRVEPDLTLDLHGHGLEAAHGLVERRLADAAERGCRLVLIVTGKGSRGPADRRGLIRANLSDWLQLSRVRPLIAAVRPAHPRHGGAGAVYVVLRRQR